MVSPTWHPLRAWPLRVLLSCLLYSFDRRAGPGGGRGTHVMRGRSRKVLAPLKWCRDGARRVFIDQANMNCLPRARSAVRGVGRVARRVSCILRRTACEVGFLACGRQRRNSCRGRGRGGRPHTYAGLLASLAILAMVQRHPTGSRLGERGSKETFVATWETSYRSSYRDLE